MRKEFRHPQAAFSRLMTSGTMTWPTVMPLSAIPVARLQRAPNQRATVESGGTHIPLIPAPRMIPKNKYSSHVLSTCDMSIQPAPKSTPQKLTTTRGPSLSVNTPARRPTVPATMEERE